MIFAQSVHCSRPKIVGRCILFLICLFVVVHASAQRLTGTLDLPDGPSEILLLDTRGGDHMVIDSAQVDRRGRFAFSQQRYPAGFYQLAINDTDRVDLILDPRENEVQVSFSGRPLQENITFHTSVENQRMWEYKMISRQSQTKLAPIHQEKATLAPGDELATGRLDSLEAAVRHEQKQALDRLIQQDTSSHFAQVVLADLRLSAAVTQGHMAVARAFNWTDGRMLRSSVFTKAIMAWMQTAPQELPDGLISASDSLLKWTQPDLETWDHTRSVLVRLFDQYGPDFVSQYLVDRYVVGEGALVPPDDMILAIVAEQMKVAIGSQAPEVLLPMPGSTDTLLLYDILAENELTALFFYSSSCDHCHEQMPHLNELYAKLQEQGFELIGIALDADREEFEETLATEKIRWPAFSELIGWGSPAAKAFLVKATPTLFLLDQRGTIIAKPYDHQELRTELERVLGD